MADPARRRATYQDVLDAPPNKVAEIIDGELELSPRPAAPHSAASSALGAELTLPFGRGRGGPGGWIILDEPELHLGENVLVPDIAGWRRERLPHVGSKVGFTLAPDWLCEVLSPATERRDRTDKLPIYARHGVAHAWLVNPLERTLEALELRDGLWVILGAWRDDARVRVAPFDAFELELGVLWADVKLEE